MLLSSFKRLGQTIGSSLRLARLIACLSTGVLLVGAAIPHSAYAEHDQVRLNAARYASPEEGLLIKALHSWEDGNSALAQTTLDSLLLLAPKFGVARSLRAAIRQLPNPKELGVYNAFMSQDMSSASKTEFEQRWAYLLNPASNPNRPSGVLQLSASQRHLVMVDLKRNRLYVFENDQGQPRLIADFYAGIGSAGIGKQLEGDRKTPVGVYFVTSEMADEELDELYGIGAFPLSYPNALDQRRQLTGNGIWLHGVPRDTWTRAPQSSRGCVTMANRDFERLKTKVTVRQTPVILSDQIEWSDGNDNTVRDTLLSAINHWAEDWESIDTDRYLKNYSEDFFGQGMSLAQWSEHKRRVNQHKTQIAVTLSDISLLKDPQSDIVIATFTQNYQSNNFASVDRKRQYWRREQNGDWKILLENGL